MLERDDSITERSLCCKDKPALVRDVCILKKHKCFTKNNMRIDMHLWKFPKINYHDQSKQEETSITNWYKSRVVDSHKNFLTAKCFYITAPTCFDDAVVCQWFAVGIEATISITSTLPCRHSFPISCSAHVIRHIYAIQLCSHTDPVRPFVWKDHDLLGEDGKWKLVFNDATWILNSTKFHRHKLQ